MRVISGKYKGKILKGFNIEGTRPTMDRVKESMFALIQNQVKDSVVLDLFAGSGQLGIEALSNYCDRCYFVDKNNIAIETIKENTKGIDNAIIIKSDYKKYLNETNIKYDIIILDPPYKSNYIKEIIDIIDEKKLLNQNGIIVCETDFPLEISRKVYKSKKYGQKYIQIYY